MKLASCSSSLTSPDQSSLQSTSYSESPILPSQTLIHRKTKWSEEEDNMLIQSVKKNGMTNWTLVASEVPGRTGKQCRERWVNQLCPSVNKDNWTAQEDQILFKQHAVYGNVWSKICKHLPGRSANAVKNRWAWIMRRRAMVAGIPIVQDSYYKPREQNQIPLPLIHQCSYTPIADVSFDLPEYHSEQALSYQVGFDEIIDNTNEPALVDDGDIPIVDEEEPDYLEDFSYWEQF